MKRNAPVKRPGRYTVLALSIFTCSHPHTIVDEPELNFCVRDGNRWTLRTINTNFSERFAIVSSAFRRACTLKTEHSDESKEWFESI